MFSLWSVSVRVRVCAFVRFFTALLLRVCFGSGEWILLVLIAVLCYAILILTVWGSLGALGIGSSAWLNLWDFVWTFLDRASDCESRVFLVLIVVLSYAVLILFVRGALGVIGTFLLSFSNQIWGSRSPPLWSPIWSFTYATMKLTETYHSAKHTYAMAGQAVE
jgi:hypothetical protein